MLGDLAAELYPRQRRIPATTVLTTDGWVPDRLVDLADIELRWLAESPTPVVSGRTAVSTRADRPTVGIPFTADARERLHTEPLSPIARACIELAWRQRTRLLGR